MMEKPNYLTIPALYFAILASFIFGRSLAMNLNTLHHLAAALLLPLFFLTTCTNVKHHNYFDSNLTKRIAVVSAIALLLIFHAVKDTLFSPFGLSQSECNYIYQGYTFATEGTFLTPWYSLPSLFPTFDTATGWCLLGLSTLCSPFFALFGYSHSTVVSLMLIAKIATFLLMLAIMKRIETPFWARLTIALCVTILWPTTLGRPEELAAPFGLGGVLLLLRENDAHPARRHILLAGMLFGIAAQHHLSAVAFFLPLACSLTFFQAFRSLTRADLTKSINALSILFFGIIISSLPSIIYHTSHWDAVVEQYFGVASHWVSLDHSSKSAQRFINMIINNRRISYDSSPFFLSPLFLILSLIPPLRLKSLRQRLRASICISIITNLFVISFLSMHGYEYLFCFIITGIGAAALFTDFYSKPSPHGVKLIQGYLFLAIAGIIVGTFAMTIHGISNMSKYYDSAWDTHHWLRRSIPRNTTVMAREQLSYTFHDYDRYYVSIFPFKTDLVDHVVSVKKKKMGLRPMLRISFKSRLPSGQPFEGYRNRRIWLRNTIRKKYSLVASSDTVVPTEFWEPYRNYEYMQIRKRNEN